MFWETGPRNGNGSMLPPSGNKTGDFIFCTVIAFITASFIWVAVVQPILTRLHRQEQHCWTGDPLVPRPWWTFWWVSCLILVLEQIIIWVLFIIFSLLLLLFCAKRSFDIPVKNQNPPNV